MKIDTDSYEIISFDIFDTLIFRNVYNPSDIFDLVEKKYNMEHEKKIVDFKEKRVNAEKDARIHNLYQEINLDMIYEELMKYYSVEELNLLKELEKEIELDISSPNYEMLNIYNNINQKKIIISDMYLDKETIEMILKKNGYENYNKLFLSSELRKTKSKGDIFKYIIDYFNISPNKILHIGDNLNSDFKNPRKYQMNSYHYLTEKKNKFNNSIVSGILNNYESKDYFYNFGFENFGILLYSFTKWINANKNNSGSLLFFARDGFIMKKAYELYTGKTNSIYFYASRRALLVPSFYCCENIDEVLDIITIDKKLGKMIKRLGLEDEDISNLLIKYNLNMDSEVSQYLIKKESNSKIRNFLEDLFPLIRSNSKKEYSEFIKYINSLNLDKKITIVDIGWFGNMQKAFNKLLLNNEISGLYIGLFPHGKLQKNMDMKGFLFDINHGNEIFQIEVLINSIFELLFTAPHGSVKKYSFNSRNHVDLYDVEFSNNITIDNINRIQQGALDFIKVMKKYEKYLFDEISPFDSVYNLLNFAIDPSKEDVEMWGDFEFYDNGISHIASSKRIKDYILHPKLFITDYKNSYWKIGFLKRNFSFFINFYKIIKKIRRVKR